MKKLARLFVVIAIGSACFLGCSKSEDFDYERALEEQRIKDSLELERKKKIIAEQAGALKAFADQHMQGATLHDSTGIWLQILEPGDNNSYTYQVSASGGILAPRISVKYKGTLLDGTVFDESKDDKAVEMSLASVIEAWQLAFLPKTFRFNGVDYTTGGLTPNGFKKGAKFRIVTPSPWAYDTATREKIPANSPLYFEIEVVDIK